MFVADAAGDFQLHALRREVRTHVVVSAGRRVEARKDAEPGLLRLEQRERRQQPLVEPVRLRADLVVFALGRIEIALVDVVVVLRLIQVGIARVGEQIAG